jgi:tRNA modification GTPase
VSGRPLAALWTPSGRGAIATVRVSLARESRLTLDLLPFRATNGRLLSAEPVGRVVFGYWGTEPAEEVVVCAVDSQSLEIHCHGGDAASQRILRDLARAGWAVVSWAEAQRETESLLAAELNAALARATTLRTAALLWELANGVFESAVRDLQSAVPDDPLAAAARIRAWLNWADFGLHLTRPWSVVLAGRPNVGKSSLINAILGYTRSLVYDQPGTTRDVVSAPTAVEGWPIELSDTAGLRESSDGLESAGIHRARQTIDAADFVIVLIDISQPVSPADRAILAEYPQAIVVAHKSDLPADDDSAPGGPDTWLRVSSKTGIGIEALVAEIARRLVPHLPPVDALVPVTERQVDVLRRALLAAESNNLASLCRSLNELIGETTDEDQADQYPSAKRNGSPATS